MWVMACRTFLEMRGTEDVAAHQRMRDEGLVIEYEPFMGPCAFVSHEWSSTKTPDFHFEHFGCLQRFMRRCAKGEVRRVEGRWSSRAGGRSLGVVEGAQLKNWVLNGYVWIDYFSVPQRGAGSVASKCVAFLGSRVSWSLRFDSSLGTGDHLSSRTRLLR